MPIFTMIGTAIATALFAGSVIAANIIAGALALGTELLVSYLNRPKQRKYSAVQGEIQYGADVYDDTVFGTSKVAGQRIYYAKYGKGNKWNADVFVLANGWCDGLDPELYFYGEKHTLKAATKVGDEIEHWTISGFEDILSIRFYDGRPGQTADAKLVADTASLDNPWKSTSVVAGCAYVVVQRKYDSKKFSKGRPDFKWVLRGLREYDPRFDSTYTGGDGPQRLADPSTWGHTLNPAIHRLNYLLGLKGQVSGRTLIGVGKSMAEIDVSSHIVAANVCDTLRNAKPTYQCSLYVKADDVHTEILKEFEDAMAGYGMYRGGLSGVIPGAPQITAASITNSDIRVDEGQKVAFRKSTDDLYNMMSGQFTSKESMWEAESLKTIKVNADITADKRIRQTANDFLQVTDPDIAQYLLNIRYRQNRKGGSATLPVSRRIGIKCDTGTWVTYAGRTWLVTERAWSPLLKCTLTLAETDSDIYDDTDIPAGPIVIPPTAPENPSILSTVENFDVSGGFISGQEGYDVPALTFTWDAPDDPTITAVRFEYQIEGGDGTVFRDQCDDPEAGTYTTTKNVVSLKTYVARATITTVPDRLRTFTELKTTATTVGAFRYPVSVESLAADLKDLQQNFASNIRALSEQIAQVALASADVDAGTYTDRQKIRQEYRAADGQIAADYKLAIDVAAGPNSALVGRVETLETEVPGKADASALSALSSTVDDQGDEIDANTSAISSLTTTVAGKADASALTTLAGTVSSQGDDIDANSSAITSLGTTVAGKADASAVSALSSQVSGQGDDITSLTTAIIALNGSDTAGNVADATFQISTSYTASTGWDSKIGMQVRTGHTGTFADAGFFMEAKDDGTTRILMDADSIVMVNGAYAAQPFVFTAGVLTLQAANIGTVTAGTIKSPDNLFVITVEDGKLEWFEETT